MKTQVSTRAPRLCAGLAAALFLCFTGVSCTAPQENGTALEGSETALEKAPRTYEMIYLLKPGGPETDDHLGYLGQAYHEADEEEQVIYWVYDKGFAPIGYYLSSGATYSFGKDGKSTPLGNQSSQKSLELLFDQTGTFRFGPLQR